MPNRSRMLDLDRPPILIVVLSIWLMFAMSTDRIAYAQSVTSQLATAVEHNDIQAAKRLISRGANVNGIGGDGILIVTQAVVKRDKSMARMLLHAGANVNQAGEYGRTPLIETAELGDGDGVMFLLAHGADPNRAASKTSGYTPLKAAVHGYSFVAAPWPSAPELRPIFRRGRRKAVRAIRALIEAGADVNATDDSGWTILMTAEVGVKTSTEVVRMLVRAGAKVNKRDKIGESALSCALARRDRSTAAYLLSHGARFDSRGIDLDIAVANGDASMVRFLVSHGADLNFRYPGNPASGMKDQSILEIAKKQGRTQIVRILRQNGAR